MPFPAPLKTALLSPLLPIAAVVFLLPFGRASELAVLVCMLGALLFFARSRAAWKVHAGAKLLLALWLCYFAAALISAFDAIHPGKSWSTVAAIIRFAPFGYYVCFAVRREARVRVLYAAIGGIVALWALDAWAQILTGFSLGGHAEAQRISGVFGAGDLKLGLVLAVLSPFVAWSARMHSGRTGLVFALLFLLGPILLAGERAAWLMYALVVIACLWREAGSPVRFAVWTVCACEMAEAHSLNGVGVRDFRYAYPEYARPGDRFLTIEACGPGQGACHPHQIVLEVLDDTGAIGLALWLIGAALAVRAWRRASAPARFRAWPAGIALFVMVFPINTHLAGGDCCSGGWWRYGVPRFTRICRVRPPRRRR